MKDPRDSPPRCTPGRLTDPPLTFTDKKKQEKGCLNALPLVKQAFKPAMAGMPIRRLYPQTRAAVRMHGHWACSESYATCGCPSRLDESEAQECRKHKSCKRDPTMNHMRYTHRCMIAMPFHLHGATSSSRATSPIRHTEKIQIPVSD